MIPIELSSSFYDAIDRELTEADREATPSTEPAGAFLDSGFEAYTDRSIASYNFLFENIEKIMALNGGRGIGVEI